MGYIYILTSPKGKSYIGQTTRPIEKRLDEHQKESSNCVAIYGAIKKHGWENFEKDYYECPDGDLNKHEELMVEVLGTLAPGGYNLKEGGGNGKHSEETKQKMSDSTKGEKHPMYGKTHAEETKEKISESLRDEKNPMYGKTHAEGTKQHIRESKRGKTYNSLKVYQYDLDGKLLGSFASTGEAGRHLKKKDASIISRCARGVQGYKTAFGFKWSYSIM
jgi:hypothetical protein